MASVCDFSEAMWRGVKELKTKNEDHQRLTLTHKMFKIIILLKNKDKTKYDELFTKLLRNKKLCHMRYLLLWGIWSALLIPACLF